MFMTLTHHPVRLFRLSCGCLREYPMMPAGAVHEVLCARCRTAVFTVWVYPDKACGARGATGGTMMSCTRIAGHDDGLPHFDVQAGGTFTTEAPKLARSSEGKTGRA
jgi:hypothetical protein